MSPACFGNCLRHRKAVISPGSNWSPLGAEQPPVLPQRFRGSRYAESRRPIGNQRLNDTSDNGSSRLLILVAAWNPSPPGILTCLFLNMTAGLADTRSTVV